MIIWYPTTGQALHPSNVVCTSTVFQRSFNTSRATHHLILGLSRCRATCYQVWLVRISFHYLFSISSIFDAKSDHWHLHSPYKFNRFHPSFKTFLGPTVLSRNTRYTDELNFVSLPSILVLPPLKGSWYFLKLKHRMTGASFTRPQDDWRAWWVLIGTQVQSEHVVQCLVPMNSAELIH